MNTVLPPPEVIFHRHLSRLPVYQRELYRGRMDLSKFAKREMAQAFEAIKNEINTRWTAHAARIRAPGGEVKLHLHSIQVTRKIISGGQVLGINKLRKLCPPRHQIRR